MNDYEQKQEAKRERYLERAEKAEQEAEQAHKSRRQIQDLIPFGQPILVGHHSEKRHRRDIAKCDRLMEKSYKESQKADHYRNKAASVGKGGISSDDPEAVQKLKDKLAKLEKYQETMKAANKIVKSKKLTDEDKIQRLQDEIKLSHANAFKLLQPDFAGRIGFPSYALQNNNANIRRIKQRIQQLESIANLKTAKIKIGQFEIVQNVEENRIQVFTDGKPPVEIRQALKSHGFRFSRYNVCWQRHLSNGAKYDAESIAKQFTESETPKT
jgi:hypothetical protein